jgi:hypothetical protein
MTTDEELLKEQLGVSKNWELQKHRHGITECTYGFLAELMALARQDERERMCDSGFAKEMDEQYEKGKLQGAKDEREKANPFCGSHKDTKCVYMCPICYDTVCKQLTSEIGRVKQAGWEERNNELLYGILTNCVAGCKESGKYHYNFCQKHYNEAIDYQKRIAELEGALKTRMDANMAYHLAKMAINPFYEKYPQIPEVFDEIIMEFDNVFQEGKFQKENKIAKKVLKHD